VSQESQARKQVIISELITIRRRSS